MCTGSSCVLFSSSRGSIFNLYFGKPFMGGGGGEKIIPHCLKRDNLAEAGSGVVAKARESKTSDSRAIGGDI